LTFGGVLRLGRAEEQYPGSGGCPRHGDIRRRFMRGRPLTPAGLWRARRRQAC